MYLGTEYVLLKKIFLDEALKPKSFNANNSAILICLGGADPNNITKQALEEIMNLFPEKNINVVVGAAYVHASSLQKICTLNKLVSLHVNIQPEEMLLLMQQSHMAVTSASTTALEYCCVKGNLFLKLTAENQKNIYHSLIQKKCAYAFEEIKQRDFNNDIISNQYNLIDGKSKERLLKIVNNLAKN